MNEGLYADLSKSKDTLRTLRDHMCGVILACEEVGLEVGDIERALSLADKIDLADGECEAMAYTGWDARHDTNKSEGRPIGNQWSNEGVDYSRGFKVHQ